MNDEFRGRIEHRQLLDLYDHWRGLWRGALLPRRAALDPLAMPRGLLGNLGLLDVERGVTQRVAGTAEPEILAAPYPREQLRYVGFEALFLPLADDGREVSHLLFGLMRERRTAPGGGFGII